MLKILFAQNYEAGSDYKETQTNPDSQPKVLASETNESRKKLLDEAIQNWGLALTDQFSKSITKSVLWDIDTESRIGWAIDLATDTLKDLEVASRVNNYSTAVLDKIVLPSISQFSKDNVENLDYSDLKFYASLFVTENWKGPIATSIDNFIAKNFQKNADWTLSSKQSWEKIRDWVWWQGIFQLIKQLDWKLWELSGFSHSDLQKADMENIRKFLKPYVDIANSTSFDQKLIETVSTIDSNVSQNMSDFMTRDQEYWISFYWQDSVAPLKPAYNNIGWDEKNQRYVNSGPSTYVPVAINSSTWATQTTQSTTWASSQNADTQNPTPVSQPAPDPSNDINKPVVWTQVSWTQNSTDTSSSTDAYSTNASPAQPQSQTSSDTSFSTSSSTHSENSSSASQPQEISRNETVDYSDWSQTKATTTYSDKIDPNFPVVDASNMWINPIEENNFSSSKNEENSSNIVVTPDMKNEFENQIRDNVKKLREQQSSLSTSDQDSYPEWTKSTKTYGKDGTFTENVNFPNGQTIDASVSYSDPVDLAISTSQPQTWVDTPSAQTPVQVPASQTLAQDLGENTSYTNLDFQTPTTTTASQVSPAVPSTDSNSPDIEVDIELDSTPNNPSDSSSSSVPFQSQPQEAQPL